MPPSVPSNPSTSNATEIKISLVKTSKQPSVVEVFEVTTTPDPFIALEVPVTELSLNVTAIQPLINLEEELVAIGVEEKTKATANLSGI